MVRIYIKSMFNVEQWLEFSISIEDLLYFFIDIAIIVDWG